MNDPGKPRMFDRLKAALEDTLQTLRDGGQLKTTVFRRDVVPPKPVRPEGFAKLRRRLNLDRQDLADMLCIDLATLDDLEAGRRAADGPLLRLIHVLRKTPKAAWPFITSTLISETPARPAQPLNGHAAEHVPEADPAVGPTAGVADANPGRADP